MTGDCHVRFGERLAGKFRWSTHLDITIDYQAFNCGDPFEEVVSKTKLKNISLQLRSLVRQHIKEVIAPYYEKIISEQFKENTPTIEVDDDGETLYLYYPSVIKQKNGYVTDNIRLEFGGRNLITPNESKIISTDISEYLGNLSFPIAQATILSPQKTYWEKITLLHYECNRPTLKDDADRISRHWYDVAMLADHDIGKQALINRKLLNEVIKIKKIFYDSGFAKYDDCLNRNVRLIPSDDHLKLLKDDFNKMLNSKMFYGEQPNFDSIINKITKLETAINQN